MWCKLGITTWNRGLMMSSPHFDRWLSDAALAEAAPRILKLAAHLGVTSSYEPPPIQREAAIAGKRGKKAIDLEPLLAYCPCSTAPDGSIQACEHIHQCREQKLACAAFHRFTSITGVPSATSSYLTADRTPSRRRYQQLYPTEE